MRCEDDSVINHTGTWRERGVKCAGAANVSASPAGFTLMELMVIIAIIGILTAVATPNVISWRNNAQLNGAVREVKAAIENVRMAAIKSNLDASLTFDGTRTFTTQTQELVGGTPNTKTVNHQLAPNVTVADNAGGTLTFNSRGMTANMMMITVTRGGSSRTITVAITGSSRVN